MDSLFISDLHLCEQRPATTRALLRFLATRTRGGDALYILGDLFDAWLGDEDDSPLARTVLDALGERSRAGVQVFLMPGNRDVLLGERFARRAGASLLPDPCCRQVGDRRVLLAHGDALCSADLGYQRYRRWIRRPVTHRLLLALPLALRRRIAAALRRHSREHTPMKPAPLLDVVPATVEEALIEYGVDLLIHGHTHRPAQHAHRNGSRLVLGDWDGAEARYVCWSAGSEPLLHAFPIAP